MTKPNSSDVHLPELLFSLSTKLSQHALQNIARPLGLDMCEWRIVHILGHAGSSTVNHLASRISMDRGGTSRAVFRLEERGIVVRSADPKDRRLSLVELTDDGARLFENGADFSNAREAELQSPMTRDEVDMLKALLMCMNERANHMLTSGWQPENWAPKPVRPREKSAAG